jgi:hypothetical protein
MITNQKIKLYTAHNCPQFGLLEDATHVLLGQGQNAGAILETALTNLCTWMEAVQMDPDIIDSLILNLQQWSKPNANVEFRNQAFNHLIDQQNDIRWISAAEGLLSFEWNSPKKCTINLSNPGNQDSGG